VCAGVASACRWSRRVPELVVERAHHDDVQERRQSDASVTSPFTVDTDNLFYGKAFDALDQLLAAPKHDKFRRI